MSDKTNGVLLAATEEEAVQFFQELPPQTFLRLTPVADDVLWGIYAEGWPGDQDVLDTVVCLASKQTGAALRVWYDGVAGCLDNLWRNGQRVESANPHHDCPRLNSKIHSVFECSALSDDTIEAAFCWADNHVWTKELIPHRS